RLRQVAARQDVVGCVPQHALELRACRRGVSRLEQRATERQPRRGVARVHGQPRARHADRLDELAVLPKLLGELREEARSRIALEASSELVDAGVSHVQNVSGPAPGTGPASRHCARAVAYHRCRITMLRMVKLYSMVAS